LLTRAIAQACHPERSVYSREVKDLELQEPLDLARETQLSIEILRCAEYGCAQDDTLWDGRRLGIGHWDFFGHWAFNARPRVR
jgi:hypothetical protein